MTIHTRCALVTEQVKRELGWNCALTQIPIGLPSTFCFNPPPLNSAESNHVGSVDIIEEKAYYFDGKDGEIVRVEEVPEELQDQRLKDHSTFETIFHRILHFSTH